MPNWCYTRYNVSGPTKDILGLHKHLEKAMDYTDEDKLHFQNGWLGALVLSLGFPKPGTEYEREDLYCRGEISYLDEPEIKGDIATIQFDTETAWSPCNKMMYTILNERFPRLLDGCKFCSEESGVGFYATNDPEYMDSYHLYIDKEGKDYFDLSFVQESELLSEANSYLDSKITSIKNLEEYLKEAEKNGEIKGYSFCKVDFIELYE